MYLSENLADGKLDVTINPAMTYGKLEGVWADRPDPLTSWLKLEGAKNIISLRLTWEQLNALHAALDALLTDHSVTTAGHSGQVEVLADRDPTSPVIEPPSRRAANVLTINGNEVTFTATDDWRLCLHTINGSTAGVSDFPAWDSYGEALAYLESVLETRPATVKP